MAKAIWNNTVIAESEKFEVVEGNIYFPPESLINEYFRQSNKATTCFWKKIANYYSINVNGSINKDAAWYYPEPSEKAKNIKNHVSFWKGVEIIKD